MRRKAIAAVANCLLKVMPKVRQSRNSGSAENPAPFILTKSLLKHLHSACVSFKVCAREGVINKLDTLVSS